MRFVVVCGARRRLWLLCWLGALSAVAQPFQFPTANHALYEKGGEEKFFAGTVGKSWTSGCFGCVRSDGWQMHEGLDIRSLLRDKRGEPTDPVLATADGTVVYLNLKPSLSNYGNYLVLRHAIDGLEIDSLYAHLREIRPGLGVGQAVKAGEPLATMGRTTNTREGISRDRAHVHFELNLFVNDHFPEWFRKSSPTERNDHGQWNGQNLVGIDPREILLLEQIEGSKFSLLNYLRNQTELCRVLVRATNFPWLKRYAALVRPNPRAAREGTAAYEIALNYNALAFELIPRAASELPSPPGRVRERPRFQLLSVNEAEERRNPCRRLVVKRGAAWELTTRGLGELDLLTY